MKKLLFSFTFVGLFLSLSSQANNTQPTETKINQTLNQQVCMDCSGNFTINGTEYTITLHDVSWWTCAKFKVGSWFK
ncbi:MAG: hypothetical protein MUF45_02395 [Spirosomaceae bacterium]|jgi:hypothetical protein|nr:hypothetical protein [Spirosomataceae bacterium]